MFRFQLYSVEDSIRKPFTLLALIHINRKSRERARRGGKHGGNSSLAAIYERFIIHSYHSSHVRLLCIVCKLLNKTKK